MKVVVTSRSARETNTDLMLIPVSQDGMKSRMAQLTGRFRLRSDHSLRDFSAKPNESLLLYGGKSGPKRVAFIGIGRKITEESVRNAAAAGARIAAKLELGTVAWSLGGFLSDEEEASAAVEGFALGSYRFDRYRTKTPKRIVRQITIIADADNLDSVRSAARRGMHISEATAFARDLVNTSPGDQTATDLANSAAEAAKEHGYSATIWDKTQIEQAGMGGLLAVNRGSENPPTFTILEWTGKDARNEKPLVLVGKGVVFDTGGLSLKPTLNSMDKMKYDMAGAAAMIGAIDAVARLELPLHVIALIPATDNRPGKDAYMPGEVVHMHSGATVEVLNTDAEGRMILADALSYAKSLDPLLVIDAATLTGAQVVALGTLAAAILANDRAYEQGDVQRLIESGMRTGDRVAPLPMWDEYAEQIKSDIADIKNVGNRHAGAITAAKFLEHFVDYPWVHLDIAGPANADDAKGYRVKGGTGFGVRLLVDYLSRFAEELAPATADETETSDEE